MIRKIVLFSFATLFITPLFAQDMADKIKWGRPLPPSKGGACFYKHSDFRGDSFCLAIGQSISSLPRGFNDKISSIRLFGRTRATIFNDRDYRGKLVPLETDVRNLRNLPLNDNAMKSWNDRISSVLISASRRR